MKLIIFYKTSMASSGRNHNPYRTGGLAANALHSVGVLRKLGIVCDLQAVKNTAELRKYLDDHEDVTHAVVEAVWLTAPEVAGLAEAHPSTEFIIRAHSKIGFLQVEPEALPIIRAVIDLSFVHKNICFSSNNEEFCRAMSEVYGPVLYLPNLYDLDASPPRARRHHGPLRIASFGASRLLKLHPNAALAALQVARRLGRDLEFFINTDNTPGSESVQNTVRNLLKGLSWAKLVEVPWQDSVTFKNTIAGMDLVYQLSATETFCLVAADAVASGVPVVVGPAVSWVPKYYHAEIDDTSHAADIGVDAVLDERVTAEEELRSLEKFIEESKEVWLKFLGVRTRKSHHWWRF